MADGGLIVGATISAQAAAIHWQCLSFKSHLNHEEHEGREEKQLVVTKTPDTTWVSVQSHIAH
jgi:hypothetical protein